MFPSALCMFVPITPAWPMVGISDAGFGKTTTNHGKEFKGLKKQKVANFGLHRTPLYDVAGTVKAGL